MKNAWKPAWKPPRETVGRYAPVLRLLRWLTPLRFGKIPAATAWPSWVHPSIHPSVNLRVNCWVARWGGSLGFIKRQWAKGLLVFAASLSAVAHLSLHLSLVYNGTNSLPHRLFLNLKRATPHRGHYACFEGPGPEGLLIKRVAGLAGDVLSYDGEGNLWIQTLWKGRALKVGKPKKRARDGRKLTPIKPGIIPPGKVFMVGDHERSFDSRYEEVGLICEKKLQGRLLVLA